MSSELVDSIINGDITDDDLAAMVEKWHAGDAPDMKLYEYMGFTEEEYTQWAKDPDSIKVK